jgi:hypothetical protein
MNPTETARTPIRRVMGFAVLGFSLYVLILLAHASPVRAAEGSCPSNEAIRVEQGEAALALPECRAYEQVSPLGAQPFFQNLGQSNETLESGRQLVVGDSKGALAAADGNRFAYFSSSAPAGSLTDGPQYLARRGPAGWNTESAIPPQSTEDTPGCLPDIQAWSSDLAYAVLADGWKTAANFCGADEPALVQGEPRGAQNLFLRENDAGSYRLLNLTPAGVAPVNATIAGYSPDLSHIVFRESARLTPGAPPLESPPLDHPDYYEYFQGNLRLLTILPDGQPVSGAVAESRTKEHGLPSTRNVVSADGERVVWETQNVAVTNVYPPTGLYLRLNAAQEPTASGECTSLEPDLACTVRVDAVQQGGTGDGEALPVFRFSSDDGSRVFFTDEQDLTPGATAAPGAPDLYEFQLDPGNPLESSVVDLTLNQSEPADVLGVAGISEDGSAVYLVASAALTPPSSQNGQGEHAQAGSPNLYLRSAGADTFIATLAGNDRCDWAQVDPHETPVGNSPQCLLSRISPDGDLLAFTSIQPLTDFNNLPDDPIECGTGNTGSFEPQPCQEIFLYQAAGGTLHCVSCSPSGSRPTGPSNLRPADNLFLPNDEPPIYGLPRNLSPTGAVYFDTKSPLLPADENGVSDVYEYSGGKLSLISSGKSPAASYFYEASQSGNDVFFLTTQPLLHADTDAETSIYDARVDGGFPEPPPAPGCEGESCRGAATQASPSGTPATPSFSGPEEGPRSPLTGPCKKGFVKKAGKCVKKPSKQKHHKAKNKNHTHKKNGNKAGDNRRAGK